MSVPDRPEGDGWERNLGAQPERSRGKRVAVVLYNGTQPSTQPVTTTAPPGWSADHARWSISRPPHAFEIAWFKVL